MNPEEALLREYEKAIDLFMFEVRLAWELVSIYFAIQIGLVSAFVILQTQKPAFAEPSWNLVLFLAGSLSSFTWFFILHRSAMWRKSWLLEGLKIERELKDRGLTLDIFKTERLMREEGLALELFDNKIRFRKRHLHEKIGALSPTHSAMLVLGFGWLGALLWILLF